MDFAPARRRQRAESIVPMINVVFLLLIFFLMTAQIAPPDPFDITPPNAEGAEAEAQPDTLYLSAGAELAYEDATGEDVFTALARRTAQEPLTIRADAALPATRLAMLLPRLNTLGINSFQLVTGAP